jgi:hypothetical protein
MFRSAGGVRRHWALGAGCVFKRHGILQEWDGAVSAAMSHSTSAIAW